MNDAQEIARSLGGIEARLKSIDETLQQSNARHNSNSERIGSLERSRSWAFGAGAAFQVLWGFLVFYNPFKGHS